MICNTCGKKMPSSVMEAHIKKQHTNLVEAVEHLEKETSSVTSLEELDKSNGRWNPGEINICQQCKEEWPSRLMELHMSVRHGL